MRKSLLLISLLFFTPAFAAQCSTPLVGVMETDGEYEGVIANLSVSISPGSGNVWVDTMPLTQIETQVSARMARDVACELLDKDCSEYDFYFLLRSNYVLVGGPSAGAPMAVCALALLLNKSLMPSVAMTGTINPDGTVGPVGSIREKALALDNYDYFLIPEASFIDPNDVGVEIVEVSDVIQAFSYYTGYDIIFENVSSERLVSEDYVSVMKMMSEELLNVSKQVLSGEAGESLLNDSEAFYENESYYSSASYSVRSLIYSFFNNSYGGNISELISNVSAGVSDFKDEFLSTLVIDHLYDLESFAITMDRISEAESLVQQALNTTDPDEALFLYAFARTRLLTAEQWSTLLDYFSSDIVIDFSVDDFRPFVIERLEAARNAVAYAQTIVDSSVLVSAGDHLNNAVVAYNNDNIVYSLFESFKARAEANLAMELRGLNGLESKIDFKRDSARRAISNSMRKGYLPLLSLSYLEYSEAFDDDAYQELIFLAYSKEFASLGLSLNEFVKYSSNEHRVSYTVEKIFDYRIINQALLVILGFVLGLSATLLGLEL